MGQNTLFCAESAVYGSGYVTDSWIKY